MSPFSSFKKILVVILAIAIGIGGVNYFIVCGSLWCSSEEPQAQSGIGMKEINATFSVPDVGVITELEGEPSKNKLEGVSIPIPLAQTSEEYATEFNNLVLTGATLERQYKEVLPKAMYKVQSAAMEGDLSSIISNLEIVNDEVAKTRGLDVAFMELVKKVDMIVETDSINEGVGLSTKTLLENARVFSKNGLAFLDQVAYINQPKPPTIEDYKKLDQLTSPVWEAAEAFALSIEQTYGVIKEVSS